MQELQKYLPIKSEEELIKFYIYAIDYRNRHKDQSTNIALFTFNASHPSRLPFVLSEGLTSIRFEFGALEAPGMPEDNTISIEDYDDQLWDRLLKLVRK